MRTPRGKKKKTLRRPSPADPPYALPLTCTALRSRSFVLSSRAEDSAWTGVAAAPRHRRPAKRPLINFTIFFFFLFFGAWGDPRALVLGKGGAGAWMDLMPTCVCACVVGSVRVLGPGAEGLVGEALPKSIRACT